VHPRLERSLLVSTFASLRFSILIHFVLPRRGRVDHDRRVDDFLEYIRYITVSTITQLYKSLKSVQCVTCVVGEACSSLRISGCRIEIKFGGWMLLRYLARKDDFHCYLRCG